MADLILEPAPFFGGYAESFGATRLEEATGFALVSLAAPRGGEDALAAAVKSAWGCDLPAHGQSTKGAGVTLLTTTADQYFAMLAGGEDLASRMVADTLGGAAYVTDQTDNWAALRLSGPLAAPALERICPLDLAAIPPGGVARTVMEHLGVIMVREAEDRFLLMTISSAAGSFLHAVETSVKNVA